MSVGRVLCPSGMPIEMWKHLGNKRVVRTRRLFNNNVKSSTMQDEWRNIIVVLIYKIKGA